MSDYPDLPWPRINDYLMEITMTHKIDQLLHSAMVNMGNLVPFDHSGIIGYLESPHKVIYQEIFGGSKSCFQSFQQYYHRVMPDVGIKTLKVVIVDWYDYRNTEYITDFVRPHNIRYSAIVANFRKFRYGDLNLSIHRSDDLPGFSSAETKMLQIVQGHLVNFCQMLSMANPDNCYPDAADIRTVFNLLTQREAEIAALLCQKCSAEIIGSRLLISPLTVYKHLENIYTKMNVNCRKDLRAKIMGLDE